MASHGEVADHEEELRSTLGPGRHFGEWWGAGIQRRYGLDEKRWSLFNTHRWSSSPVGCCHVVPVLYSGVFSFQAVQLALATLTAHGSQAAPEFMNPEGIVVYLEGARTLLKKTFDDSHKEAKP